MPSSSRPAVPTRRRARRSRKHPPGITAQFPQAALAAAELPEETKATLKQRLAEAEAVHARGYEIGNGVMMGKALVVLDEIKARLSQ